MRISLLLAAIAAVGCHAVEVAAVPAIALHEIRVEAGGRALQVTLAIFSAKDFRLEVINNPAGSTGPRFVTLAGAMHASGSVAGCNGGFFEQHPFAPVGLLVSGGERIGRLNPDSWMQGVLAIKNDQPTLEPAAAFREAPGLTGAIQAGPWLVRAGRAATENNHGPRARRTFICHDQTGQWALGASEPCTLQELAALLKDPQITAWLDIQEALNLDGGPSTGLWCQRTAGNFYLQERWSVRDYLAVVPRTSP